MKILKSGNILNQYKIDIFYDFYLFSFMTLEQYLSYVQGQTEQINKIKLVLFEKLSLVIALIIYK